MLLYWQTVLIDERADQEGLRWPPSWAAGNDYLHRAGPILTRDSRGKEYLTSDVVYADLGKVASILPTNRLSPLGGRPYRAVKRLYPLDARNRAFAFSIVFQISASPVFIISRNLRSLPLVANAAGLNISTEEIAEWVSGLEVLFRPNGQVYPICRLGRVLGEHLLSATQGSSKSTTGGRFASVGNSLVLSADISYSGDARNVPDLVVDRPPSVHGRPFVALCNSNGPSAARRRLRTYSLRTFAEIDIANYLYGRFRAPKIKEHGWVNERARVSVEYLARSSPYGISGHDGRRMWQLSVNRPGASVGVIGRLARHRLSLLLPPAASPWVKGSVVVMENNYTFNGPVGAAGTNARGILMVGGSQIDAAQLARELQQLSKYLFDLNSADSDAPELAAAATDAERGDFVAVESKLKRISRRALGAANELTLAVAGAVIAHSIGVG